MDAESNDPAIGESPLGTEGEYGSPEAVPPGEEQVSDSREPPPARSSRRRTAVAVGVAFVVVVAALGLAFVAGVGPFSRPTPNTGVVSSGQTYAQATAVANRSASAYGSGPWSPVLAAGVDTPASLLVSTALPANIFGSTCPGTAENTSTLTTFDGYSGAYSSGESPDWLFLMVESPQTLLLVTVIAGGGTVWEKFSGAGCAIFANSGGLPSTTPDSPTILQRFMSGGGANYINSHPGGSLTFDAFGAYGSGDWWVGYSTCPANEAPFHGTAYGYSQQFFLGNGSAAGAATSGATSQCNGLNLVGGTPLQSGITAPLSAALGLSPVQGTLTAYGSNYTVTVTRTTLSLVWDDLSFTIANSTGTRVAGTFTDSVVISAASGCTIATGFLGIAYYAPPTSGGCASSSSGGSAKIQMGDVVTVSHGGLFADSGMLLSISGAPQYGGFINLTIPAISQTRQALGSVLTISSVTFADTSLGPTYSVTVLTAAPGLVWAEVPVEITNRTGSVASSPYAVDIYEASGCEVAAGVPNSSLYYAPFASSCPPPRGASGVVAVGDQISITSGVALRGSPYHWVAEGENLYNSSVTQTFAGVVTPVQGLLNLSAVSEGSGSAGYTYSVNVTSVSGGLTVSDLLVAVSTTAGQLVPGPYAVEVLGASGCMVATGTVNNSSWSMPTSNGCPSRVLGGSAPIMLADRFTVLSHAQLYGATGYNSREELRVSGTDTFGGWVQSPLSVNGGPLNFVLPPTNLPTSGSGSSGYFYTLTFPKVNGSIFARDIGATGLSASYGPLSGPRLVNITAASGCVLATGPVNSSAYQVPTFNACANVTLGANAVLTAGFSIVLYSTASLTGQGDWLAVYAYGPYYGYFYYGIS